MGDKEFEGNVRVRITEKEVKIWVCKKGKNIFRFKATGKIYKDPNEQDIMIIGR